MPNIEADLSSLRSAKCFTQLNFSRGYWQIPMSEEDSILHAFIGVECIILPNGTLQGGKNAGQHFESEPLKRFISSMNLSSHGSVIPLCMFAHPKYLSTDSSSSSRSSAPQTSDWMPSYSISIVLKILGPRS